MNYSSILYMSTYVILEYVYVCISPVKNKTKQNMQAKRKIGKKHRNPFHKRGKTNY